MSKTIELCRAAKAAAFTVALRSDEEINQALEKMADELIASTEEILAANSSDVEAARGAVSEVMIDRLRLTPDRIAGMAKGIRDITKLPTPLGRVLDLKVREDGLEIKKISVPFGVIGIIYESRPNVTSDAAALAIKSGNACVLRGGKEAYRSSYAIVAAMKRALRASKISENAINLVEDTTRVSANELMTANGLIDLLIPRGGAGLIRACVENATVPCLETGTGICHVYVDRAADLAMATKILVNAKTSRPSVCNAAEVCLVHRDAANEFLPMMKKALVDERIARGLSPVELRLDSEAAKLIDGVAASDGDFDTEFLDYKLAVGIVEDIDAAIAHISKHTTHHSEAIVTSDEKAAELFTAAIDSAAVYVNASTRFTDGGEFGLGCEMGISTQKLHARGPLGIEELTTYKYIVTGKGHIR